MAEQSFREETLQIIKEIESNPGSTQRTLSAKMGISLGKTNYLMHELIKKGFVKARSFSRNPRKLKTINYILTEEGFKTKVNLLNHFLKIKEREYFQLKKELESLAQTK